MRDFEVLAVIGGALSVALISILAFGVADCRRPFWGPSFAYCGTATVGSIGEGNQ